jgi:hypothetical protein
VPGHLVDLPRLQRVHAGQGPARRALHHQPHLRHLRRQPRHLRRLCAEHGRRGGDAGARRLDHQPGRGGRVHVRPQHLPGQPGGRGLLRADGEGDQSVGPGAGREHRRAARGGARVSHHRRHHAGAQPVLGGLLSGGAADEPPGPRDVLPDGGPARAPLHAVPGWGGDRAQPAALHRVPHPADEIRRLRQAGGAASRRPVRLLLRRAPRLREGGRAPRAPRLLGRLPASRTPRPATTATRP